MTSSVQAPPNFRGPAETVTCPTVRGTNTGCLAALYIYQLHVGREMQKG